MSKQIFQTFAATAVLGLALGGCMQQDHGPHDIARVLPRADDVKIALPESASTSAAVGDIAEWYVATRDVTRTLNGGTAYVLILVHTIVQFPATSVEGKTTTWGPHHEPLDPAEWRLIVTELEDGTYDWHLDGHSLTEPESGFETILSGNANGDGTGTFMLDFDAAERVNPIDNDGRGVIDVAYDIANRSLDIGVDSVEDLDGVATDVHFDYAYREADDRSGDMVFSLFADTADAGTAKEEATLRSRWLATGEGRADVRLRNGDLDLEVTASECWSSSFRRMFYTDSAEWLPTEGDAGDCAFADSDLPE